MQFRSSDINPMDTRRRGAFVNSLSGFKSANLVGTANAQCHTNVATMSSALHLGSNPPLLALVIRPGEEARHARAYCSPTTVPLGRLALTTPTFSSA